MGVRLPRNPRHMAQVAIAVAVFVLSAGCARTPGGHGLRLESRGVYALLDVMDTVAALHPGFEERLAALATLPEAQRERALHAARRRNEESPSLDAAIRTLLATEAYQIYFRRFPNLPPGVFRDLLLDLPFQHRPAPGGMGQTLYDLVRRRDHVRRALERFTTGLDLDRVSETAVRWSPDRPVPALTMFLIYDSNAGSFTAEGTPFYNVYGSREFTRLVADSLPVSFDEVEGVMAHELQHVLAEPVLYPDSAPSRSWQQEWVDRITRAMVGEGVANHCNRPTGAKREVYEDERVVTDLVRRLNEAFEAVDQGRMTEADMTQWSRANYGSHAERLLGEHLAQRYDGAALERRMRELMPVRPDLEHALGWWMVSRVTGVRGDRAQEMARALLADPRSLYGRYNDAVAGQPDLQVSATVLALASRE